VAWHHRRSSLGPLSAHRGLVSDDPAPLVWIVPDDALSELRAALEDFEKYADFRLLRAARAVTRAASPGPS
jgi:hypothetical protein